MKETTRKLLPGLLMLVAASLFFLVAILRAQWGEKPLAVWIALGAMWLSIGIVSLRRARRQK